MHSTQRIDGDPSLPDDTEPPADPQSTDATPAKVVAAVDLGSNSFHLKVAQVIDGHFHVVDRLKEMVRVAAGLDATNQLDAEAIERALTCLERFGQRLENVPSEHVRVVGTNTLRRARNARGFLRQAETALGHPIDVISGIEEARLIYAGVAHHVPLNDEQRLAIDIGGGSTEIIIGQGFSPLLLESLYMGCVGFSQTYFPDGKIRRDGMRRAELAALQELEPVFSHYKRTGWSTAYGTSGTIINIHEVIREKGWSEKGITPSALKQLRSAVIDAGHTDQLSLPGLQKERAPVFPGGVAILSALFDALGVKRLERCDGALREGLLYDVLGRLGPEDTRESTVQGLMSRYRVDTEQASRVERSAIQLKNQVAKAWRLRKQGYEDMLKWAARLHEIGLAIAHSQHHKHAAYLLEYADMPGFSHQEQALLAVLVRAHRRKFPSEIFDILDTGQTRATRLAVLLRLAVVLNRSRSDTPPPELSAEADDERLTLSFPEAWLAEHPLTRVDLEQEAAYLKHAGIRLRFSEEVVGAA